VQPTTVPGLRKIGLNGIPEFQLEAAIEDWLRHNEPNPTMVHSLKRNGFGHLLKH
jgi:hypothetical protein